MSERKYTDEEFIKALEYCVVHTGCPDDCPLKQERKCYNIMTNKAYDLINRKNAEIAVLTTAVDNSTKEFLKLHDEYQDQKAEIERLQEYYKLYFDGEREIKELQENIEHLQGKIGLYEAEVEEWKANANDWQNQYLKLIEEMEIYQEHIDQDIIYAKAIKAEVIKEFAKKLHKAINDFRDKREMVMLPYTESALLIIERKIDNLVAEMTEGE